MITLEELTCPNCGAAIGARAFRGSVASCAHCNTTFRVPDSLTPEPEMGDLLLGADFSDPQVPGWRVLNREKLEFRSGQPPEMVVNFPASDQIHPVLRTAGPFDDVDLSVSMRFIKGSYEHISAGFEVRSGKPGDYTIRISAQGTYQIGSHDGTDWGGTLVKWTDHPSLRGEMGQTNRLRVVMRGERMRVYLNGVLATSLRDSRFPSGLVRLVVTPSNKRRRLVVAFSDLQLREVG